MPSGIGLTDVTSMPHGMELPTLGAAIAGRAIWHADHNCQVKIKLDGWGSE
ncbi:hypothetical protein [Streptomyces sp. NPDC004324]